MCKWGTNKIVTLCQPRPISRDMEVPVDECIAPLVQLLNDHGVRTTGCCCGHGKGPGSISFEDAKGSLREIPLKTCGALMEGCRHDDPMVSEDFTEEDSKAWERAEAAKLKKQILALIEKEPGMYSSDVAERLDISYGLAYRLTGQLLAEGHLR